MKLSKKTILIGTLLAGTVFATATLAEMGPGGPGAGAGEGQGPRLLEMFDAIDANSDGKLSLEELEAHRAAEFAAADTNGDGKLDHDELIARETARFQERLEMRVQRMLDNRDSDGDGNLTSDEIGKGPGESRFARIDTDNDGAISKAEAEDAMKHRKKRGMQDEAAEDDTN